MDLSIIFQVHRENSGHSSDINGIDWENCSMRAYHHGAVPCIHLALSVVLRGSVQETRGVARIVEERHAGPCTYRLFLFRFTFDKTKKGNQTFLYRFSFFILSNKN